MEVVAICGSPRGNGNTATLIEALLDGAREAGAQTTRFDPAKMRIQDCTAGDQKRMIDRLYAFYTTEGGEWRLGLEGQRRGVVIVVQADAEQETPRRVAEYLEQILRAYNVEPVGRIAEPNLAKLGDAAKRADLVARARELGRELASP